MISKQISIEIIEHRKTGLLIASSNDLKGFLAHGRDYDDLETNIRSAIRALLEAQGHSVEQVEPVATNEKSQAFAPRQRVYNAEMVAA